MTPEIEKKRREIFLIQMGKVLLDEGYDTETVPLMFEQGSNGEFTSTRIWGAWQGFNAALDAVEIELPSNRDVNHDKAAISAIDSCRQSIKATGLGLKVQ